MKNSGNTRRRPAYFSSFAASESPSQQCAIPSEPIMGLGCFVK
jgi:hypothetical protein